MSKRTALFLLVCCISNTALLCAQSLADWDWVNSHFNQVLHDLFPVEERAGVYIAYRSHRDLHTEVPEYSFILGYVAATKGTGLNAYLTAKVREADSVSVYDQMMKLHRSAPTSPAADIQKQLRVRAFDLTEMSCPAVKTQFVKFQQVAMTAPKFDVIVLHPLIHEFRVRAGTADMDVSIVDEENSYVTWAIETRRPLEACTKSAR